jgi:hypothetical protein
MGDRVAPRERDRVFFLPIVVSIETNNNSKTANVCGVAKERDVAQECVADPAMMQAGIT